MKAKDLKAGMFVCAQFLTQGQVLYVGEQGVLLRHIYSENYGEEMFWTYSYLEEFEFEELPARAVDSEFAKFMG